MGLGTWFDVVDDVMLQRWHTRHLPTDPAEVLGPDVKGKTFIVTGPTSGIGTTTAETLARAGARVVLACRTVKRGQALIDLREDPSQVWTDCVVEVSEPQTKLRHREPAQVGSHLGQQAGEQAVAVL